MFSETMDTLSTKTQGREAFITKSFQHLLLGIGFFAAIEYYLFSSGTAEKIANALVGVNWLLVLGAFMIVAFLASSAAHNAKTKGMQYAALFGFVIAEAIIFVPLLYFAEMRVPGVIKSASVVTAVGFAGLAAIAFHTRKDFSFLGGFLKWMGFIAIALIVASVFGFISLGMWFSVAMIAYSGAAILFKMSQIILHYPEDRYVAAGLELFAAIMLMLWYMVRFLTAFSGD